MTTPSATVSLKRSKLLWAFIIGAIFLGIVQANYYHPKEGSVELPENMVKERVASISYNTSGPLITSYKKGCFTTDDFGLGPEYYCLELYYKGGPGVVELKIPSQLLEDWHWIRTIEQHATPQIPVPFERTGHDNRYTTFRVALPSEQKYDNHIELKSGDQFPLWLDHILGVMTFSGLSFVGMVLLWIVLNVVIGKLKTKPIG